MKRLMLISITIMLLSLVSCDLFNPENNDPPVNMSIDNDSIPEWYPSRLTVSSERLVEYQNSLTDFEQTYDLDLSHAENNNLCARLEETYLEPRIKICTFTDPEKYNTEFEQGVLDFIENWRHIVSSDTFQVDTFGLWKSYGYGEFYIKNHYDYPIYSQHPRLGYFRAFVDSAGYLYRLTSDLVPQLQVPKNPMVDADSAKNMIIGYPWYYYGYSGNRIDCVVDSSEINSVTLNVYIDRYPRDRDDIVYRLIWCVSTDELPVDFLIDAMTGEFITYIQNFRT